MCITTWHKKTLQLTAKNANLKYYDMGSTFLQMAKEARKIYVNRSSIEMVDDKKLLMSLLFSNSTINGKKVEISYHKAFKMVSARVMQMLGEKIDEKNTFEPPKEPVNKGKTPAFADVNPIWLRMLVDVRTYDSRVSETLG